MKTASTREIIEYLQAYEKIHGIGVFEKYQCYWLSNKKYRIKEKEIKMNPIFENILMGIVALSFGSCAIGFTVILIDLIICLIKNLMKFK